ncbi:MAG TPA: FKBP-type peptidyl-prolyl cis-trans isomerase, partial [Phycisphaerae bacterium]|nr:FKBP-type peptidyl-prolyl cis-trans isomerase [Phycisphaerae bacterium]
TLNLSHLTFSGPAAKDFSFTSSIANLSLTPGQSATLTIKFLPKAAGARLATLTLPGTDAKHPFLLQLAGTGVAAKTISTAAAGAGGIVQVATTKAGKGSAAANGQIVSITYVGYLANGTVFDSSAAHPATAKTGLMLRLDNDYAQNQPFLNKDKSISYIDGNNVDIPVIAGWEFGLQGIKPGEGRTFIMNAAAAYGDQGAGSIPPGATIRFDVQCVSILSAPRLNVTADDSNGNPTALVGSGQTTISANAGTLLSLSANQTSASQKFSLFSVFNDNANGMPLANITISNINLSGPAANDFSIIRTGNVLTLTFHPTAAGNRNATVHIHSSDKTHPDFTFAVQGRVTASNLALAKIS